MQVTLWHGSGRLASGAARRRKAAPFPTLGPPPCRSKPKRLVAATGLSRDWGSCRDSCWRMRIVGGLEAPPEAGAERAVVDGAANLEQ